MITNTTGETVMATRKMTKAAKIRKLVRKGLTTKEISVEVGCTYNYVYIIKAAMKKKVTPSAEERRVVAKKTMGLDIIKRTIAALQSESQKPTMPVPPAELGLASLDPAMNAYSSMNHEGQGRKVSHYHKAKVLKEKIAAQRTIDERHQLIERVAKGVLYVASAGICVAIAYVFTL